MVTSRLQQNRRKLHIISFLYSNHSRGDNLQGIWHILSLSPDQESSQYPSLLVASGQILYSPFHATKPSNPSLPFVLSKSSFARLEQFHRPHFLSRDFAALQDKRIILLINDTREEPIIVSAINLLLWAQCKPLNRHKQRELEIKQYKILAVYLHNDDMHEINTKKLSS